MLRQQDWLQPPHALSSISSLLQGHVVGILMAPTWYLGPAASSSPSRSQVTMGLGLPNAMQVRVMLLPSFASTYCGGVSVKVGGAGEGAECCHPPHPTLSCRGTGTEVGTCCEPFLPRKGAGSTQRLTGLKLQGQQCHSTTWKARIPPGTPHGTLSSSAQHSFPPRFPSRINSLLSKQKKTPQCRSKDSFLTKEVGRITARP